MIRNVCGSLFDNLGAGCKEASLVSLSDDNLERLTELFSQRKSLFSLNSL